MITNALRTNAPLRVFDFEEGTLFAYSDFSPKFKIGKYYWQYNFFFTAAGERRRFVISKEVWSFSSKTGELYSVDHVSEV